jgi:hypothetical protein
MKREKKGRCFLVFGSKTGHMTVSAAQRNILHHEIYSWKLFFI